MFRSFVSFCIHRQKRENEERKKKQTTRTLDGMMMKPAYTFKHQITYHDAREESTLLCVCLCDADVREKVKVERRRDA